MLLNIIKIFVFVLIFNFPKSQENITYGYRAKESILHILWEQDNWLEKYVKNKMSLIYNMIMFN